MVYLVDDKFVPVISGDATQIRQAIFSELHGLALDRNLVW